MRNVFTALLFFISISLFSQDEKRLALVIGNANYDIGELKNPVNDARLIASTLDSLEFDVILKENLATKRDMTAAIREFGSKRSDYDVAFVYYAGHGIQVDDENFLLPTKEVFEEEFDVIDYGVSVQNIMRYLRAQTDEVNILILDACRDNPFESNWNTTRSLKGGGLAKIPPPTGSLIAFSTDSGQTAPDGDGDNSTYTVSLAKNMLKKGVTIGQVFRNVRAEVMDKTNGLQRPVEATQLVGSGFYLNNYNSPFEKYKFFNLPDGWTDNTSEGRNFNNLERALGNEKLISMLKNEGLNNITLLNYSRHDLKNFNGVSPTINLIVLTQPSPLFEMYDIYKNEEGFRKGVVRNIMQQLPNLKVIEGLNEIKINSLTLLKFVTSFKLQDKFNVRSWTYLIRHDGVDFQINFSDILPGNYEDIKPNYLNLNSGEDWSAFYEKILNNINLN